MANTENIIKVGYSGIIINCESSNEQIEYLNMEVHELYTTYSIVHDICDVAPNFIMIDDFLEMCNNSNYYVPRGNWGEEIDIFDMVAVGAVLSVGLEDPTYKRRVWVTVTDVFPDLNPTKVQRLAQAIRNHDTFDYRCEWKYRDKADCLCIAKPVDKNREQVIRSRKIYKLGQTRDELRGYWHSIVYALNFAFKDKHIPISVAQRDLHNIDVVIAFAKRQGITFDDVSKRTYYYKHDTDACKIQKQLYRSPTKYKIIPKKLEKKVDNTK